MAKTFLRLAAVVAIVAAAAAQSSFADPLNLKCSIRDEKGQQWDSQIVIDQAANSMRVNGGSLPLEMANGYYSSIERGVLPGFVTVRHIDRQTGQIKVTMMSGSDIRGVSTGNCEKAAPAPSAKF